MVEIADSSLAYDLGRKASLYAGFGIAELWVIDAVKLETRMHREPTGGDYLSMRNALPPEPLVPMLVPELAVTLSKLELY